MAFYDVDNAMTVKLDYELPKVPAFREGIRRAPRREAHLSEADKALAIRNALRYIHPDHHLQMAREFARELEEHGRIYGYRFRPEGELHGKPIDQYKGSCIEAKAFQVMIDNNLDFDVALYPYELVTYGETGQVCQNWMQYRLIKKYLEVMTDEQTLVVMSGHPLGLFHSHKLAPRCIITNGLMVGTFDDQKNFNRAAALGVANYGQMTAGGWMYIGPQGIVHGTFNTLLNAGRLDHTKGSGCHNIIVRGKGTICGGGQVLAGHVVGLAVPQPTVHGLRHRAHAPLFHQQLADVGTAQHGVGELGLQLREGDGEAVGGQLIHNGLIPGLPLRHEPVDHFLEGGGGRVHQVAQNVGAGVLVVGGDLDAREHLDPQPFACLQGLGDPGHGVVIGEGHRPQVGIPGQLDDLGGREGAVGGGGVGVEVYPVLAGGNCAVCHISPPAIR